MDDFAKLKFIDLSTLCVSRNKHLKLPEQNSGQLKFFEKNQHFFDVRVYDDIAWNNYLLETIKSNTDGVVILFDCFLEWHKIQPMFLRGSQSNHLFVVSEFTAIEELSNKLSKFEDILLKLDVEARKLPLKGIVLTNMSVYYWQSKDNGKKTWFSVVDQLERLQAKYGCTIIRGMWDFTSKRE
ncbi:Hypothetical protein PP7435_CHR2-0796 [Komagataella phaffii CBS 7435]|uniref:RNA binding protein required for maturation of tRNA and snRNAs n=2 Tax=Komagataella phaffii TaxID=460519 RepID=C4R0V5_KOMPG|nr:uncharacterized protein PAS_chr2-1_0499 [Komagataella phaffii GS115]AOA61955.1 GQ67_00544T0 [Komagataella phaffii]CAH2448349.1 Hypothetical protein BQ9382_C2-4285 [Komagataella phaffii CBS 7435]AOA68183.1 GQ68_00844T0 [Komagataella phaffii GS115]CAY69129.1 RNA binding protein required for maturation of tRNA and snRNA precursors [Komagataella phaffii GS115]CCA38479.1 Hypothetical protein PP7435_CHR2-0796 [Komagataella phaffii CBS 7435]